MVCTASCSVEFLCVLLQKSTSAYLF